MDLNVMITKICADIVYELELPDNGVYLYKNISSRGENKGNTISYSICINEPEYPQVPGKKYSVNKSAIIMNIPNTYSEEIELIIKNNQFKVIPVPEKAYIKEFQPDKEFTHIIFKEVNNELMNYIREHILYSVENYESSNSFGCCSKFTACSNAKKCVHENKLYGKGCAYEKHLRKGEIFYGKNRNID